MTRRWVLLSDFSGEVIQNEEEAARVEVEHYPDFPDQVILNARPEEVFSQLDEAGVSDFVVLTYTDAESEGKTRYVLPRDTFESLFQREIEVTDILQEALETQRQQEAQQTRRRGQRRTTGRRQDRGRRESIDYSSAEHAGEPHPGRITEAEKEYVRDHLNEVNTRLRRQGVREIDPADPMMAERYGLQEGITVDAEVIEEIPPER